MRFTRHHLRSGNCTPILACPDYANFHVAVPIALIGVLAFFCGAIRAAHGASSEPPPVQNVEVTIFAAPDELSAVVERTRDGESLSPMGEMIGPGGLKWFMVKTRTGNVGWIKATDNTASRKIDGHFRSLPNEVTTIEPASTSASISLKTSAKGAITVPVKVVRAKVTVPVTFNNSVTSYLAIDTGAAQTMISKRLARDLRLLSLALEGRRGIGGSVTVDVGRVESIKVGDAEVTNMRVSIHDHGLDRDYEGLLGFDFLGHFTMSLDSAKQVLVLTPR